MLFCSVERAAGAKKITFCIPKNAIFKVKMVCYEGGFKKIYCGVILCYFAVQSAPQARKFCKLDLQRGDF